MTLSVLTLNILHDHGDWPARADRIREWIERLDPDLIGLQEVLSGSARDQGAELLAERGYHVAFGAASKFWRDRDLDFGNTVAARWPLERVEVFDLPGTREGDGHEESRSMIGAEVATPHGPVAFHSTHLHWRFDHGYARESQVVRLCERVRSRAPENGFPPILVGDFNAEPDSTEIRYVRGLQSLERTSVHFRDAWSEVNGLDPGHTWSGRNPLTRPWLEPDRRIDYVFVGSPRPGGLGRVEECRVVCDDEREGVWPSDHFGVYAELRTEPDPSLSA